MELQTSAEVQCPYCGEFFTTFVDLSAGNQDYIEDCQVCCQPIQMRLVVEDLEHEEFGLFTETSS